MFSIFRWLVHLYGIWTLNPPLDALLQPNISSVSSYSAVLSNLQIPLYRWTRIWSLAIVFVVPKQSFLFYRQSVLFYLSISILCISLFWSKLLRWSLVLSVSSVYLVTAGPISAVAVLLMKLFNLDYFRSGSTKSSSSTWYDKETGENSFFHQITQSAYCLLKDWKMAFIIK